MSNPANLKTLSFLRAKTIVQCILQGSLLDPGPLVSCEKQMVTDKKFVAVQALTRPQKFIEVTSLCIDQDKRIYVNSLLVLQNFTTARKSGHRTTHYKSRMRQTYTDDNFRIIGQARSLFHLGVLESVYIQTQHPVLCRQNEFVCALKLFN